jgi:hypothetical protein
MKSLFIITETSKHVVRRMWYFRANDLLELATNIVENDKQYGNFLLRLGGNAKWDVHSAHYQRPTPEGLLDAIQNAYESSRQSHYFQIHLIQPENSGEYFARWVDQHGVHFIPELDQPPVFSS